jgi:hypothetical protein
MRTSNIRADWRSLPTVEERYAALVDWLTPNELADMQWRARQRKKWLAEQEKQKVEDEAA